MTYTDQQLTEARTFLKEHLQGKTLDESSAVTALALFLAENGGSSAEPAPVTESTEFKELQAQLDAKIAEHAEAIHQRDHNWNSLQKASKENSALEIAVAQFKVDLEAANTKIASLTPEQESPKIAPDAVESK